MRLLRTFDVKQDIWHVGALQSRFPVMLRQESTAIMQFCHLDQLEFMKSVSYLKLSVCSVAPHHCSQLAL